MPDVLAILTSDLHLTLTAPVARSCEPDWLEAQGRYLKQLRQLQDEHGCPVIFAGDIFDRWLVVPELINWAIDRLPYGYAIPGQHDLPMHRLEDVKKSGYWTLVQAQVLEDLSEPDAWKDRSDDWTVHGFPWGEPIGLEGREDEPDAGLQVAVVHKYLWINGKSYPGADEGGHLSKCRLEGYDAAVFGDNHIGFTAKSGRCSVMNCGCLIPRKSDERKLKPQVGLLKSDGTIERHLLDASQDRWLELEEELDTAARSQTEMERFLKELGSLENDRLDFREAVVRWVDDNKVSDGVKQAVLRALGE